MKDAQLNTLCQRHQAVLINSASNSITVAVVDAPLMRYWTLCISPRKNRLILCAGLASKWKIIGISRIRHPRQTPRKAEKPQPSFSIRHYARRWRNAPLISISNPRQPLPNKTPHRWRSSYSAGHRQRDGACTDGQIESPGKFGHR